MLVAGGVEDAGAVAAGADEAGGAQLGEVLGDGGGRAPTWSASSLTECSPWSRAHTIFSRVGSASSFSTPAATSNSTSSGSTACLRICAVTQAAYRRAGQDDKRRTISTIRGHGFGRIAVRGCWRLRAPPARVAPSTTTGRVPVPGRSRASKSTGRCAVEADGLVGQGQGRATATPAWMSRACGRRLRCGFGSGSRWSGWRRSWRPSRRRCPGRCRGRLQVGRRTRARRSRRARSRWRGGTRRRWRIRRRRSRSWAGTSRPGRRTVRRRGFGDVGVAEPDRLAAFLAAGPQPAGQLLAGRRGRRR